MFGWWNKPVQEPEQESYDAEQDFLEQLQEALSSSTYNNVYVDQDAILNRIHSEFAVGGLKKYQPKSLAHMQARAYEIYRTNAHGKNVVNTILNFTVGEGFCEKFLTESQQNRWKKDRRKLKWRRRVREIGRRVLRDGEAFVRRVGGDSERRRGLRFINASQVSTPQDLINRTNIKDGVEFDPNDVERVLFYHVKFGDDYQKIPASEIFHFKDPESSFNDLRGRPPLYDAADDLDAYDDFLRIRKLLNEIRSSLAYIRKHKNTTPAQVKNFVAALRDGTLSKLGNSGRQVNWAHISKGVGVDTTDNIDLEFPRSNLDATDAEIDGRTLRLKGACWFQLPEYMYGCDARNANFSSTLVAETPGMKALQSWQIHFEDSLQDFFDWWFKEDVEVEFTWPTMVSRDPASEASANEIMFNAGIISRQTWQERQGLSPEVEEQRGAAPQTLDTGVDDGEEEDEFDNEGESE